MLLEARLEFSLALGLLTLLVRVGNAQHNAWTPNENSGESSSFVQCMDNTDWPTVRATCSSVPQLPCYRIPWRANTSGESTGQLPRVTLVAVLDCSKWSNGRGQCGPLLHRSGIRKALEETETFLFAAEEMRRSISAMYPHLQYVLQDLEIRDSCSDPRQGMQHAIDIVKSTSVGSSVCDTTEYSIFSDDYYRVLSTKCEHGGPSSSQQSGGSASGEEVFVVVGAPDNSVLGAISPVLSTMKVPHVSFGGSSNVFDKNPRNSRLFRTAGCHRHQSSAIVEMLKHFDWRYVFALGSKDDFIGASGLQHFREELSKLPEDEFCLAHEMQFSVNDDEREIENILWYIVTGQSRDRTTSLEHKAASAVVLFADVEHVQKLFDVMERLVLHKEKQFTLALRDRHLIWIASDDWLYHAPDILRARPALAAIGHHDFIGFMPTMSPVIRAKWHGYMSRLSEHFHGLRLSVESVRHNPWLASLWEQQRNCTVRLLNSNCDFYGSGCCDETESAADAFGISSTDLRKRSTALPLSLAVEAALLAIAEAVRNVSQNYPGETADRIHRALQNITTLCTEPGNRTANCPLFDDLQKLQHPAFSLVKAHTLRNGTNSSEVVQHSDLVWMGHWTPRDGLELECATQLRNKSQCFEWASGSRSPPLSVCSEHCRPGQRRQAFLYQSRPPCCWQCYNCSSSTHSTSWNSTNCTTCPKHEIPSPDRSTCVFPEYTFMGLDQTFSQTIVGLSGSGIVVLLVIWLLFWYKSKSLVIKASEFDRERTFIILIFTFINAAVLPAVKPSKPFCVGVSISTASVILGMSLSLVFRSLHVIALRNRPRKEAPQPEKSYHEDPRVVYGKRPSERSETSAREATPLASTSTETASLAPSSSGSDSRSGAQADPPSQESTDQEQSEEPGSRSDQQPSGEQVEEGPNSQTESQRQRSIARMIYGATIKLPIDAVAFILSGIGDLLKRVTFSLADSIATSALKRYIWYGVILIIVGPVLHGSLQLLDPHYQDYVAPGGPYFHLVCQEKKRFTFISSGLIIFSIICSLIASFNAMLVSLKYPRFAVPPSKDKKVRLITDGWTMTGKVPQEGHLLWLTSLTYTLVFISLLPTFLVTARVLYTVLFAMVQILLAYIVLTVLFLTRLYKVLPEMTIQYRYTMWRIFRHMRKAYRDRRERRFNQPILTEKEERKRKELRESFFP